MRFMHKETRTPVEVGNRVFKGVWANSHRTGHKHKEDAYAVVGVEEGEYGSSPMITVRHGDAVDQMYLHDEEDWGSLGIVFADVAFTKLFLVGRYTPSTKQFKYTITDWWVEGGEEFLVKEFWVCQELPHGFDPYKAQLEQFDRQEGNLNDRFHRDIARVEENRNSMQALEYHPTMEKV